MTKKNITIAAPAYNEEKAISVFLKEIEDVLFYSQNDQYARLIDRYSFSVLIVNDGSTDGTLSTLMNYKGRLDLKIADMSRNYGHIAACSACLDLMEGDAMILMDSDMQDDPAILPEFILKWEEGYDVVYAVRTARKEAGVYKYLFNSFYRILNALTNIRIPLNAGNFSLMDRKIVDQMRKIPLRSRYLPGIRAYVGFQQTGVPVPRRGRHDKKSRVGLKGLFRLAFTGIFSFSYVPIRLFNILGALSLAVSCCLALYALWGKLIGQTAAVAWASQIITISFFGGVNILGLGIIGEYVARIYDQIKGYPSYIINDIIVPDNKGETDG
jgi:dolichol-phosphate mannosyltransferase